ncbi:MAG: 23S rRNA (guanosine(2251)-2'-O)-methyltransferase RlmB [Proteobacteria bacterium]|nr:23S rRNA (guanosine(2251)-2'-O)-methyltransferase RlmB [Pseudomonadota bacterium]
MNPNHPNNRRAGANADTNGRRTGANGRQADANANTNGRRTGANADTNGRRTDANADTNGRRTGNSRTQAHEKPQASRAAKYEDPDVFFVCGLHPVEEALNALPEETLRQSHLYIAQTRDSKDLEPIQKQAEALGLQAHACAMQELTRKAGETRHQGVLLELPKFKYTELDTVLDALSPQPLIVVLDQIQDPHNLGAIIRSAAAFGADAVVIARDRCAQITATSLKTSAGQAYKLPICRVSNIAQTLRQLKTLDFNIVGADIDGCTESEIDYHRATALIMGSEGTGMRRLTRTLCDQTVRIAQNPAVESLNVSVATAILLHTASTQRTLPWRS